MASDCDDVEAAGQVTALLLMMQVIVVMTMQVTMVENKRTGAKRCMKQIKTLATQVRSVAWCDAGDICSLVRRR